MIRDGSEPCGTSTTVHLRLAMLITSVRKPLVPWRSALARKDLAGRKSRGEMWSPGPGVSSSDLRV